MARAGWSAKDSMESLSTVIKFTESAGGDLATTTDLITDSMDAFGVGASEIAKFADVLTFADTKVNSSSLQLAEAFKEAGGSFRNISASIEESVALISSISSVAKGSEAGNALTTLLARITSGTSEAKAGIDELGVSIYDRTGEIRNIIDIIEDLSKSLKKLKDSERFNLIKRIGGLHYLSEFNMLMEWGKIDPNTGTSKLRDMTKLIESESAGTLNAKWGLTASGIGYVKETIKSTWQELQIEVIESNKSLIVEMLESFKNSIAKITPQLTESFGKLLEVSIPFMTKVIEGFPTIMKWIPAITKVVTALAGLKLALKGIETTISGLKWLKSLLTVLENSSILKILGKYALPVAGGGAVAYGGYKIAKEVISRNSSTSYPENKVLVQNLDDKTVVKYSPYREVMNSRLEEATGGNSLLKNAQKIKGYANGTNYFTGGLAQINERGGELQILPSGTTIIPADKSEKIINNKDSNITMNLNIGTFIGTDEFLDMTLKKMDKMIGVIMTR